LTPGAAAPAAASSARIFRASTPGVNHWWFSGAGRLLCRAKNAWIPPSDVWLFPPRALTHDVGGYSVEWEGEDKSHRPGFLPPAAFVFVLAFDALHQEAAAARGGRLGHFADGVRSLLNRARRGGGGGGERGDGGSGGRGGGGDSGGALEARRGGAGGH